MFLTQHFSSKKKKRSKVRKSEFWRHIWACHSRFSGYRVFNCQNWIKIAVFTIFLFWSLTTIVQQILLAKFRKTNLVLRNGPYDICKFLHATLIWHGSYNQWRSLFGPIGMKTNLPDSYTFLNWTKRCFFEFSQTE